METLEGESCGCHKLETGSIYTLLRRMEHKGLLESEWERAAKSGPERRVYKVTKMGTEALRSGLESIAKRKPMMDDLAEFYSKNFMDK
jgi:DNA-binding PadR family transcriptional regulator